MIGLPDIGIAWRVRATAEDVLSELLADPTCVSVFDFAPARTFSDAGGTVTVTNGDPIRAYREPKTDLLFTVPSGANPPHWIADSSYHDLPCARFLYTSSEALYNATWGAIYGQQSASVAAVLNWASGTQDMAWGLQGNVLSPQYAGTNMNVYFDTNRYATFGRQYRFTNMWQFVYDGTRSTDATKLRCWMNNRERDTASHSGAAFGSTLPAGAGLYLGRGTAGGSSYFSGDLMLLAFFVAGAAP